MSRSEYISASSLQAVAILSLLIPASAAFAGTIGPGTTFDPAFSGSVDLVGNLAYGDSVDYLDESSNPASARAFRTQSYAVKFGVTSANAGTISDIALPVFIPALSDSGGRDPFGPPLAPASQAVKVSIVTDLANPASAIGSWFLNSDTFADDPLVNPTIPKVNLSTSVALLAGSEYYLLVEVGAGYQAYWYETTAGGTNPAFKATSGHYYTDENNVNSKVFLPNEPFGPVGDLGLGFEITTIATSNSAVPLPPAALAGGALLLPLIARRKSGR